MEIKRTHSMAFRKRCEIMLRLYIFRGFEINGFTLCKRFRVNERCYIKLITKYKIPEHSDITGLITDHLYLTRSINKQQRFGVLSIATSITKAES